MKYSLLIYALLALTQACNTPQKSISNTQAFVTAEQAMVAFDAVKSTEPYLPYNYTSDGCYARALYMSLELAIKKIPSSSQFVTCKKKTSCLNVKSSNWRYHVAPMIIISDSPEEERTEDEYLSKIYKNHDVDQPIVDGSHLIPLVLDPSIFDRPVSRSTWLNAMSPKGNFSVTAVPSNFFNPTEPISKPITTEIIHSFEEMPMFKLSDIKKACGAANIFISLENISEEQKRIKTAKLIKRTEYLVRELQKPEINKLNKDAGFRNFKCEYIDF